MFRKKTFYSLLNFTFLFLFAGMFSLQAQVLTIPNPVQYDRLEDIINFVLNNVVRQVILLGFVGLLIYGGWVRMTAQDDSGKLASSQKIIAAAIGGFAIVVLAPVIVSFVGNLLGVSGNLGALGN